MRARDRRTLIQISTLVDMGEEREAFLFYLRSGYPLLPYEQFKKARQRGRQLRRLREKGDSSHG